MNGSDDDLLAIDVDPDAYATTAAEDQEAANHADRTHLSDAAFAEIKATYVAKHDNGNVHSFSTKRTFNLHCIVLTIRATASSIPPIFPATTKQ